MDVPISNPPYGQSPLSPAELAALLGPLRRDYARTIVSVAARPLPERVALIEQRVAAYSAAFAAALGGALDDAAGGR